MSTTPPKYHVCRILLLLVAKMLFAVSVNAQEVEVRRQTTGTAGTSAGHQQAGRQFIIQQSIGQASVHGASAAGNYSLRQGFIQPWLLVATVAKTTDLKASIFPNPFGSQFQIRLEDEVDGVVDIQIFDLNGRAIFHKQFAAAQLIAVDFPPAGAGMYLIRIKSGKKQYTGRIQKLNL